MQLVEPKDKRPMVRRWTPRHADRLMVKAAGFDTDIYARFHIEETRMDDYVNPYIHGPRHD